MFTLPETNIFAPENGWLEDDRFLLGWPIFRGELLVSGRVFFFETPKISGDRTFELRDRLQKLERCLFVVFCMVSWEETTSTFVRNFGEMICFFSSKKSSRPEFSSNKIGG